MQLPGAFVPPPFATAPRPLPEGSFERAKAQVTGPAVGIMVVSGLSFLWWIAVVVMVLFAGGIGFLQGSGSDPMAGLVGGLVAAAIYGFFALAALITFVGAMRMKAMKTYWLAFTSAIISILPCTTYICCMLMMPFGIWALVVLLKPDVKKEFR